jgi:hypothetical protein
MPKELAAQFEKEYDLEPDSVKVNCIRNPIKCLFSHICKVLNST